MLPEGWRIEPLASVIQSGRKITYGIVQPGGFVDDGVILVRGGDYSTGWVPVQQMKRVRPEIDAPYRRSRLRAGDLLITIVGANTGTIATVPPWLEGANITQTTARVAIDEAKASASFISHILKSDWGQEEVRKYVKGAAQPGLNLEDVELFRLPLPPLPEQRRIAAVIDAWDDAIAIIQRLTDKKRDIFECVLARVIDPLLTGDRTVRSLFATVGSGAWGNEGKQGLRILRNTDFGKDGYLILKDAPIRSLSERDTKRTLLIDGDLLLEKSGGSPDQPVGRVSRFVGQDGYSFSNFLLRLTPGPDVTSLFCYFALERMYQRRDPLYFQQQTTGIRNLEWQDYLDLPITVPAQSEQTRITLALTDVESSKHQVELLLVKLRFQKRGLARQLLSGKLRVPESIDALLPPAPELVAAA